MLAKNVTDSERVVLDDLVFTLSWEDPALDRRALRIQYGKSVAAVSSGGCNCLCFLLDNPEQVLAFDYNPTQCWVLELKVAALRELDHAEVLELFGIRESARRAALFERALRALQPPARDYWSNQHWVVKRGLLNGGRYERFVAAFRKALRWLQGQPRVRGLFDATQLSEQRRYFDEQWDTWRWRQLFKVFFNKTVLARRGLSAEYFTFDDGQRSFADSFAQRARNALRELPIRDNYFVAQYLLGKYLNESALPEYLLPQNFGLVRERLGRLSIVHSDVRELFTERRHFDAVCLSNVFELMSEEETATVFERVAEALAPGARITLRNLMIPRRVHDGLARTLVWDRAESEAGLNADRSFVYSSFQVYTRSDREGKVQ